MNDCLLGQPWALKHVWAVNVQNYTILPGTLSLDPAREAHRCLQPTRSACCAKYTHMIVSIDDSDAEDKPEHAGWLNQKRLGINLLYVST